ncbi:MAG TPA: YidC/Oxa1 family membrane protein insertase [Candidatus Paceibacterota bacterium]
MITSVFHALIYDPIYNGLVFLVDIVPSHDIGIAVIVVTILVRILLFPLSRRAIKAQMAMKEVAPDVEALKQKHKDDAQKQTQAIFALYKERDVHPFAGFLVILIQIPVLLGLYWVFALGGFPTIDASLLYSFVPPPEQIKMEFLGLIDMAAKHNIVLAVFVALSQLVLSRLSMGPRDTKTPIEATFSGDMARSFDLQARYVFPLIFGAISYFVAAAAPLYWLTSNIFMVGQELATGRRFNPKK